MGYFSGWTYLAQYKCYCLENVLYCQNPADRQRQCMNIFVPEEFFYPDGTMNYSGVVTSHHGKKYTWETVPVIYNNFSNGYWGTGPLPVCNKNERYLNKGYVVVCPGNRGRDKATMETSAKGRAPAAIVDLKAGIRFLRHYQKQLPGNMDKLISAGFSAGGAMSALLGASGNNREYFPYLKKIGAFMDERDDVYAAYCGCPILDIENADVAYEWMFGGLLEYQGEFDPVPKLNDRFQQMLSKRLALLYPAMIQALDCKLWLGPDGRSGTYYEQLLKEITLALNRYMYCHFDSEAKKLEYIDSLNKGGRYVFWNESENAAYVNDLDAVVQNHTLRSKACPAFDSLTLDSPENEVFSHKNGAPAHFSDWISEAVKNCCYEAVDGCGRDYLEAYDKHTYPEDIKEIVHLFNAMDFLMKPEQSHTARHYRIRCGTRDSATAFSVSYNLALAAAHYAGCQVDFKLIWNAGHKEFDDIEEFTVWVDRIMN